MQLWEDFQCPACAQFEKTLQPTLIAAAQQQKINLQWRPTTFLDQNLKNTASVLATSAWGCAINAAKPVEYHSAVFAAQPKQEGAGYTQQQLLDIGQQVGIAGADYSTFEACVKANTFDGWAANSYNLFNEQGVQGTPTMYVNGKEVPVSGIQNGDQLMAAINKAAA